MPNMLGELLAGSTHTLKVGRPLKKSMMAAC